MSSNGKGAGGEKMDLNASPDGQQDSSDVKHTESLVGSVPSRLMGKKAEHIDSSYENIKDRSGVVASNLKKCINESSPPHRQMMSITARDDSTAVLLEKLAKLYMETIRPLEKRYLFEFFDHDVLSFVDFVSKPQILILGQYSTGKALIAGKENRMIKGPVLSKVKELPFSGLEKFGADFLENFEASTCDAEILEHLTFIDTPGLLGNENQHIKRGYTYSDVAKWFADRSDLIFIVFDVYKLDISDEIQNLLMVLKPYLSKIRIILNKAQDVDADRLIKVYGALMWGLGRTLGKNSAVPRVFVGNFWGATSQLPESAPEDSCFEEERSELWKELLSLPTSVGLRRVNDLMKRVHLLKAHAAIMYDMKRRTSQRWFGSAQKEAILKDLRHVFRSVRENHAIEERDMPCLKQFRARLEKVDFSSMPKISKAELRNLDLITENDIPNVLEKSGSISNILKVNKGSTQGRRAKSRESIESIGGGFKKSRTSTVRSVRTAVFLLMLIASIAGAAILLTGKSSEDLMQRASGLKKCVSTSVDRMRAKINKNLERKEDDPIERHSSGNVM